jgi:hypothetical protein
MSAGKQHEPCLALSNTHLGWAGPRRNPGPGRNSGRTSLNASHQNPKVSSGFRLLKASRTQQKWSEVAEQWLLCQQALKQPDCVRISSHNWEMRNNETHYQEMTEVKSPCGSTNSSARSGRAMTAPSPRCESDYGSPVIRRCYSDSDAFEDDASRRKAEAKSTIQLKDHATSTLSRPRKVAEWDFRNTICFWFVRSPKCCRLEHCCTCRPPAPM